MEVDLDAATAAPALDLDQLYRRYAGVVLRRALRFYPRSEAEEVVHEVFLEVMQKMDGFRADASPSTWLWRITTNRCLNRLRDAGRRAALLVEHHDAVPGVAARHEDAEARASLAAVWRVVDPALLRVGVYAYVDGLSHDEIAALEGCSPRTVGNRLMALAEAAKEVAR